MDVEAHHAGEFAPTSSTSGAVYSHKRTRQDVGWTVAYCLLSALVFFWAFPAFAKSNAYSYDFYQNSTTCDPAAFESAWPAFKPNRTVVQHTAEDEQFSKAFGTAIAVWLPITFVSGILLSVVYLLMFRHHAQKMVWLSAAVTPIFCVAIALGLFFAGAWPGGIVLLVFALIWASIFYCIRAQLRQCARLMEVAGRGLAENTRLIPVAIGIKVCGVSVLIYQTAAFISALMVGKPVPQFGVVTYPAAQTGMGAQVGYCTYDAQYLQAQPTVTEVGTYSNNVACCTTKVPAWASALSFFAMIALLWTSQLVLQVKLYVVADTIAQWYFKPAGAFSNGPDQPSVQLALRHAMVEGFGSSAFASAVLTLIGLLRSMLRQKARENWFFCLLNCVLQPILQMCEQFTKFATIAAAITGQSFYRSAQHIFGVLKRNFMQTYTMWWAPDFVCNMTVFVFTLAWGGLVFLVSWAGLSKSAGDSAPGAAAIVALLCALCMGYILAFISHMLLDIANTIYVCFSLDRDAHAVTRPEIHAIYNELPIFVQGAVIEQPDGGMDYGRPEASRPPGATQPVAGAHLGAAAAPPPYTGAVAMQPLYSNQAYGGYSDQQPVASWGTGYQYVQQAPAAGPGAQPAPGYPRI